MKTAFICNETNNLHYVFSNQIIDSLKEHGFDSNCYKKEDVLKNKSAFVDTEYVFSTWGMPEFTEQEIKEYLPALKCVFYAAGSVQSFARPFLNCSVKVFSAWAANAVPVAEYALAQIILAGKGFFRCSSISDKNSYYQARDTFSGYTGNYNARVGILGAGMIGKLVIKMLKSYKLDVMVFDPFLSDEKAAQLGVEKSSLEDIFSRCNVISNHLANNEQTKGMLVGAFFERMMPNSTFINTGRGAQVVEPELCAVLKNRPDIVAVLDVTYPEPPEDGHEFYSLKNCILTPHMAGSSGNEVHRMAEYMLNEYMRFIGGEPTEYEVTAEMLKTMA